MKKILFTAAFWLFLFYVDGYAQSKEKFALGLKAGVGFTDFQNYGGIGARVILSAEKKIKTNFRIAGEYSFSNYIYADTAINLSFYYVQHLGLKTEYLWVNKPKFNLFSGLGLLAHHTTGIYLSHELINNGIVLPEIILNNFLSAQFSSGIRYKFEQAPISIEFTPFILNLGQKEYLAFHSDLGLIIHF